MSTPRKVEVFSASCGACDEAVNAVKRLACTACEVTVLDMSGIDVAQRATALGIRSVPAVVIDGVLATCCAERGFDEASLRAAELGRP